MSDIKKAALHQDVSTLNLLLMMAIVELYSDIEMERLTCEVDPRELIWWLICRHIEDCCLLQVKNFNYRSPTHEALYYALINKRPGFNVLLSQFIRAPNIYRDNEVEVFLNGRELQIQYYTKSGQSTK